MLVVIVAFFGGLARMADLLLRVRLPGAKEAETVTLRGDLTANEAIGVIATQLGVGNLTQRHLVVAPTARKSGAVVPPSMRLSQIQFDPSKDILEVWKTPVMVSICIYFKEGAAENARDRKTIALDAGAAPLRMIPTLQRALDLPDQEFSLQHAERLDNDGRATNSRWLHCSTPLEDQGVDLSQGHLMCYPLSKITKVSLHPEPERES